MSNSKNIKTIQVNEAKEVKNNESKFLIEEKIITKSSILSRLKKILFR